MSIALPALVAATMTRPVPRAIDGIAEAYLALAATVRQQDSGDFAMMLLRLALDLRPDFTAARLLAADILESGRHLDNALQMLAAVGNDDPLIAVIRLQRAALAERLGHTEEAMRDLQRIARDYPDSPLPAMREGDILREQAALRRCDRCLRPRHRAHRRRRRRTTGWCSTIAASATSGRASGRRRRRTSSTR